MQFQVGLGYTCLMFFTTSNNGTFLRANVDIEQATSPQPVWLHDLVICSCIAAGCAGQVLPRMTHDDVEYK